MTRQRKAGLGNQNVCELVASLVLKHLPMPTSLVQHWPEDVAITAAVEKAMQEVGNPSLEAGLCTEWVNGHGMRTGGGYGREMIGLLETIPSITSLLST